MLASLQSGNEVLTTGGIVGTIVSITGDMLILRVKPDNVKLQIARSAVSSLVKPETISRGKEVNPAMNMTSNLKFRAIAIVAVILVCMYGIIGLPTSKQELIDNWKKNIRLGLDLKGGSQLMLQVQLQDAFKAEADTVIQRLKDELAQGQHHLHRDEPQRSADRSQTRRHHPDRYQRRPGHQAGNFRQIVQRQFRQRLDSDAGQLDRLPADHAAQLRAEAEGRHADPEHQHHRAARSTAWVFRKRACSSAAARTRRSRDPGAASRRGRSGARQADSEDAGRAGTG